MSDDHANSIAIAVVQEQIAGVREQQKAHALNTQERFNGLENKLDDLTAIMNRGKGAYTASMVFAGAIGAVIMGVIAWVSNVFHSGVAK